MRTFVHVLLAVIFVLFAYVNLNDADAFIWVLAYTAVAVVLGLAAGRRADRRITLGLTIVLGAWMLTMLPGMIDWFQNGMPSITDEMKATAPHIEVVREFLGLAIAVAALLWSWWRTPRRLPVAGK